MHPISAAADPRRKASYAMRFTELLAGTGLFAFAFAMTLLLLVGLS